MRVKLAGATVNQTPIDWKGNTANILASMAEARRQGARLLCFPELCVTGYGCEDLFLSDWVAEEAWRQTKIIAAQCANMTVVVGLPVRWDGVTYNGACVISNCVVQGITLKQNLARDGVHYEPRWFDAWPAHETKTLSYHGEDVRVGDLTYHVEGIHVGFEICEDAWRKEKRPGYRLKSRGVQLILNPSASHFAMGKSELRQQQVVMDGSRLFECAYLFVNLLGNEAGRMVYDGDIIFGQRGRMLKINHRLSLQPWNVLSSEVDFSDHSRSETAPITDGKTANEELARAASLALFDYLRKSKAKGFVLSLSGGADSSMCAVLVAEMIRRASRELGWARFNELTGLPPATDNVTTATALLLTCAYQGTKNSSAATFQSAQELASSLGAAFHHWTIDEPISYYTQQIERAIGRPLSWEADDIALQNIQARGRSPVIWLLANIQRAVLLTTSNRSEGDVGYATMDGDTSGSLAPIAGLDKPFILQWLRYAQHALGYHGLAHVNNLTPTAELRPHERAQTDEKDLMPYAILVAIEKLAIRDRQPPHKVFEQLAHQYDRAELKTHVIKFFRLWAANQWKRERLAPSFHFDDLNVDPRSWCRFPILSGSFEQELAALAAS
ncbi:MAG: NAD(+) synthase [Cyclobacteriaceae bacterium]|jgi:NAD+ synthase (glutamine-hydrolysing)|nr:NAD(+) synthase [Cyclobacteriaceae bacterium]